jgi:hypothetical protein
MRSLRSGPEAQRSDRDQDLRAERPLELRHPYPSPCQGLEGSRYTPPIRSLMTLRKGGPYRLTARLESTRGE